LGILKKPLDKIEPKQMKVINNPKGEIYKFLKKSDPCLPNFGEAYFTSIFHNETKGWKRHSKMSLNIVVVNGKVAFYIHSEEQESTKKIILADNDFCSLSIPPGYWLAFQGVSNFQSVILNIADIEHDPLESENRDLSAFPMEINL